jgi:hypothetical protein
MAKGMRAELFIVRDNGADVTQEMQFKMIRKILALLKRLGCTPHGTFNLTEPDGVEDLLEQSQVEKDAVEAGVK